MLVGTDIEFGVIKDHCLIPAGLLPCSGHKGRPQMLDTGGVEIDNVSLELTISPASNANEFATILRNHMEEAQRFFGITFYDGDCAEYDLAVLLDAPFAMMFGCEPDINVYTGKKKTPSILEDMIGFRSFGGHIHVGAPMNKKDMVKAMDLCVGVGLVALGLDKPERKRLYGQAGSYRNKPYGIEYRTPGNGWWKWPEKVFELTELAYSLHKNLPTLWPEEEIILVINTCDVPAANAIHQELIDVYGNSITKAA